MPHDHTHERGAHEHGAHDQGDAHAGAAPAARSHDHVNEQGHERGHGHAAETSGLSAEAVADCPVMPGSAVVKADAEASGLFRDHEGTRYWFCCDACGPLFDADSQRYVTAA
ncbi:YHS domain-containing protein [Promicromonospora soli]